MKNFFYFNFVDTKLLCAETFIDLSGFNADLLEDKKKKKTILSKFKHKIELKRLRRKMSLSTIDYFSVKKVGLSSLGKSILISNSVYFLVKKSVSFFNFYFNNFLYNSTTAYYNNNKLFSFDNYISIVLRVTLNNIFFTVINKKGEVLLSLSGGNVGMKGSQRKSVTSLKLMLRSLISFLKKNRLENKVFFLFFKTNWISLRNIIIKDLLSNNIFVNFIILDLKRCHNGLRKRKLRNR